MNYSLSISIACGVQVFSFRTGDAGFLSNASISASRIDGKSDCRLDLTFWRIGCACSIHVSGMQSAHEWELFLPDRFG
jgi:hypothetical protein